MRIILFLFLLFPIFLVAQPLTQQEKGVNKYGTASDSLFIQSLIEKGRLLVEKHTDSAFFLLQEAVKKSELIDCNDCMAKSLMQLSTVYAVKNDIRQAKKVISQAKKYCLQSANQTRLLFNWYRDLAIIYKYAGQTDSALNALKNILPLLEKLNDTLLTLNTYNHIASVLIDNQNYEDSYHYSQKAMEMNTKKNDNLIISYIHMAYYYANKHNSDSLYYYASNAYDLARELNATKLERTSTLLLTKYYLSKNDYNAAKHHAINAIRLIDKHSLDNYIYVYRLLGSFYFRHTSDYNQAIYYTQKAAEVLQPSHLFRKDIIVIFLQLAEINKTVGNTDQAYDYLTKYLQLSDSINNIERNKSVDELEKQFRLLEKEKEIAQKENQLLLQNNSIRNRNLWITIIASLGMILLLLMITSFRNQRKKLFILQQKKEIDQLKAYLEGEEKERKRIAVELHDHLGGMLSTASYNLNSLSHEPLSLKEENLLMKMNSLVMGVRNEIRKTAHALMPDILIKHDLPEALRQYCQVIEKDTGIVIHVQQQGDFIAIDKDIQLNLYRIAQELIQNAIKHAKASQIILLMHASEDLLSLTIEDDGIGFDQHQVTTGMGLYTIENRLKIMQGKITIDSAPGKGTSIYIELNV